MALKSNILRELRNKSNKNCVRALEDLHEKSFYTIQDWIKNNNPLLSTVESLNIISTYLEVDSADLIRNLKVVDV